MMELRGRWAVVTGGAGFIGSHLVDALLARDCRLVVLDDLSSGRREFLPLQHHHHLRLKELDLLQEDFTEFLQGCEVACHLAADPDVRAGERYPRRHFESNLLMTQRFLEACRAQDVPEVLFTSTSTVYGEATAKPTPEDYGPLLPISTYGASKLAAEALVSGFAGTYGIRASIFRFANVVGLRSTHGVIHDFVEKLRRNPRQLEILGRDPGTRKSYCHVEDVVEGMLVGHGHLKEGVEVYNIGSEDWVTVREIADSVVRAMGLKGVEYRWSGGVDGGRGWKGDVREMRLAIDRLEALGWKPKYTSGQAVARAALEALAEHR